MRRRFSALTLFALGALAAFAAPRSADAATGRITVEANGQKRGVLLIEYGRLKKAPRTTIIVLRSAGTRARGASADRRGGIGLTPVVRNAGVVVAYPEAIDQRWNLESGGVDDIAFIRTLVNKLVSDGVANRRRVFIAGVSSGGILAMKMACEGADHVAGYAVMIANMPEKMAANCKIAKPSAFMLMNGVADPVMPWGGGKAKLDVFTENVVSAEATVAPFAAAASCGTERARQEVPDKDPSDGSRVIFERYNGCKTPVELVRVEGGGHTLPGRPAPADRGVPVGARNNDVSTPRVIWEFFRRAAQ